MKRSLWLPLLIALGMLASCSKDEFAGIDREDPEDVQVNKKVDEYLRSMYLWNGEYQTLTPDYEQPYKDFLRTSLLRLTTNTLDKKAATDSTYALYSYIEKRIVATDDGTASHATVDTEPDGSNGAPAPALAKDSKELEYSFGFTGLTALALNQGDSTNFYFCVQGVFPDSEADRQGLKRGDVLGGCDGQRLSRDTYQNVYLRLLQPEKAETVSLMRYALRDSSLVEDGSVSVTASATYCNPIIYNKVETRGGRTVGYLVYDNFDAGFDQELLDAFTSLKSQGANELVLDLRYNRGGRTTTANLLASCIAGEQAQGKVFFSMRYNDTRMADRGGKRSDEQFSWPTYKSLDQNITAGALGLSRVVVLVTGTTASASELVVNGLRGIGLKVILIGETTEGKNVGMEYKDIKVPSGNTYRLSPITFQTYNALGQSDYDSGFTPDIVVDEHHPDGNERVYVLPRPYGQANEPLYARAMELLTGVAAAAPARAAAAAGSVHATPLPTPQIVRPGHSGSIY